MNIFGTGDLFPSKSENSAEKETGNVNDAAVTAESKRNGMETDKILNGSDPEPGGPASDPAGTKKEEKSITVDGTQLSPESENLRRELGGVQEGPLVIPKEDPLRIPEGFKRTNLVSCVGRIIRVTEDWMGRGCIEVDVPVSGSATWHPSFSVPYNSPMAEFMQFGRNVKITGHIEAFWRRIWQDDNRYEYTQTFVADKIEFVPSEMEEVFGITGKWVANKYLTLAFGGEVRTKIDRAPSWGSIAIEVPGIGENQMPSVVNIDYFKGFGSRLPAFDNLHARSSTGKTHKKITRRGSFVYLTASMHISEKPSDSGTIVHENIRANEIAIL